MSLLSTHDASAPADGRAEWLVSRSVATAEKFEIYDEISQIVNAGRIRAGYRYLTAKRLVDLALAAASLTVLAPLFFAVSLLIVYESGFPIFFRQERIGERLRRFSIYKFRTMYWTEHTDSNSANLIANAVHPRRPRVEAEGRVTRVGRFLRLWSIDELPQIFNILRGDMSFVGPRPLSVAESLAVSPRALRRYSLPPGLSGLAQIRDRLAGFDPSRFEPDLEYVERANLWLDLRIMIATISSIKQK